MGENPTIFLLCSERSGSNLICRMFDAHPSFCAPSPSHLLRVFGQNIHRYKASNVGWTEFKRDLQRLFDAKVSSWCLDQTRLPENWPGSFARAIIQVYHREAELNKKQGLFIKENHLYSIWPFIADEVPAAGILFQTRDPRDMAVSWLKSPLIRGGVVRAARMWCQDQEAALRLVASVRSSRRVASVRYEDLVTEPERTLTSACADLEIPFHASMLDFHKNRSAKHQASGSVDWRNVASPLLHDNTGKYCTELNKHQVAYIEATCGPLMDALGYTRVTPADSPYGSFSSFKELERSLEGQEPWNKPEFNSVPASERKTRERWSNVRADIETRPPVI